MSIEHQWIDISELPKTKILTFDYIGKWTWDEFHALHKQVIETLEQDDLYIYPIINIGTNTYLPPAAMTNLRNDQLMEHPRVIQVSMVIDNMFIRMIANMVTKLRKFETQPRFYHDLEDAHIWINTQVKHRATG